MPDDHIVGLRRCVLVELGSLRRVSSSHLIIRHEIPRALMRVTVREILRAFKRTRGVLADEHNRVLGVSRPLSRSHSRVPILPRVKQFVDTQVTVDVNQMICILGI